MRNSNLLPVKAKGDVRFRSVASLRTSPTFAMPVRSRSPLMVLAARPVATSWEITSSSCSPRKTEMIAGGASLPPRRRSLPTSAADSRSRSA